MAFRGIADSSVGVQQQQLDRAQRDRQLAASNRAAAHRRRMDEERLGMEKQQQRVALRGQLLGQQQQQQQMRQQQQDAAHKAKMDKLDLEKRQREADEFIRIDKQAHEQRAIDERLKRQTVQSGIAGLYASALTNLYSSEEALEYFNARLGLKPGQKGYLTKGYFDDNGSFTLEQLGDNEKEPLVTRLPVQQQINMTRWLYGNDDKRVEAMFDTLKKTHEGNMKLQGELDKIREEWRMKTEFAKKTREEEERNKPIKDAEEREKRRGVAEEKFQDDLRRRKAGLAKDYSADNDASRKGGKEPTPAGRLPPTEIKRVDDEIKRLEDLIKNASPDEDMSMESGRLDRYKELRDQHDKSLVDPEYEAKMDRELSEKYAKRFQTAQGNLTAAQEAFEKAKASLPEGKKTSKEYETAEADFLAARIDYLRLENKMGGILQPVETPKAFRMTIPADIKKGVDLPPPKDGFLATEYTTMSVGGENYPISINALADQRGIRLVTGMKNSNTGATEESPNALYYEPFTEVDEETGEETTEYRLTGDDMTLRNLKQLIGEDALNYVAEKAMSATRERELKAAEEDLKKKRKVLKEGTYYTRAEDLLNNAP